MGRARLVLTKLHLTLPALTYLWMTLLLIFSFLLVALLAITHTLAYRAGAQSRYDRNPVRERDTLAERPGRAGGHEPPVVVGAGRPPASAGGHLPPTRQRLFSRGRVRRTHNPKGAGMKTFIVELHGSIEAESIEEATDKARTLYEAGDREGWNIHDTSVARAREDKPIEMFSFGSSDFYQNPAAQQESTATTA